MLLFSAAAPLCLPRVNVLDGRQSIRRAYTPEEFRGLIAQAVAGTGGNFRHTVAPFWIRQMADIRYALGGGRGCMGEREWAATEHPGTSCGACGCSRRRGGFGSPAIPLYRSPH